MSKLNKKMGRVGARKQRELQAKREEQLATHAALVKEALNQDCTTRSAISKATGIKLWQISELFKENLELYAEYTVRRKTLVDTAADNIHDIVMDKDHPQHFSASKYVLSKYKSDLDSILDASEEASLSLEIGGGDRTSQASPIRISFKGGKQDNEDD
jgi:hypothetical protein